MIAAIEPDPPKRRSLRVLHDVHGSACVDDPLAIGGDARVGSVFEFEHVERLKLLRGFAGSDKRSNGNQAKGAGDDQDGL